MAGTSIRTSPRARPDSNGSRSETRVIGAMLEKRSAATGTWLLVGSIVFFVAAGFFLFGPTGQDDSYISYWPAYTLAKFGRILNYNGQAVEQSSSLLWVFCLGLLAFITRAPVPLLGPLVSIAAGALAILVASRLAARISGRVQIWAVLFTATACYLVYWSLSGMETTLAAACIAWLALVYSDFISGAYTRRFELVGATLCVLLVRPEMGAVLGLMLGLLIGA